MLMMKDSGIEWMGEIPSGWDIKRFKYLHMGSNVGDSVDKNFYSDVDGKYLFYMAGVNPIKTSYSNFPVWKYTKEDDLLLARNGTPYVYLSKTGSIYSDHVIRTTICKSIDKRFVRYCLQRSIESEIVDSVSIATWSISLWNEQYVPIPEIQIQHRIADFLDSKCAEIDALSADIQAEIDTLEEYKRSVMFDKVLHGLSSDDIMVETDSDVWDKIPQGWKLVDIKYLFEIVKRIAGKEGFDVLSVTQKGLRVKDITSGDGQLADDYSGYQFVYPTDYVMNHMDLLTGWVDLSSMFGVTSPDYRVFRLRDKKNNSLEYYKFVMQCCYMNRIFYSLGQGVSNLGRWRLQTSAFNNFKVPVPPLEEQVAIAEYLNRTISEADTIITEKKNQLATLDEYKKSVIYEYATGKKEVPDA